MYPTFFNVSGQTVFSGIFLSIGVFMSDNKKYYYLKFKETYFDQDHIKVIEAMENGYIYSVIILKLYLKALKYDGQLKINDAIPYDRNKVDILSKVIGHDPDHVMKAINIAISFGIIRVIDTGEIFMADIHSFIGQGSSEGDRKRKYRKHLEDGGTMSQKCPDICPPELELELEIEKEIDIYNRRFESIWSKYPNKDGKKQALKHFLATVKTDQDWTNIQQALDNYLNSRRVKTGFIKNGSTWFNNWADWTHYTEVLSEKEEREAHDAELRRKCFRE